jgi:hypothetical protein
MSDLRLVPDHWPCQKPQSDPCIRKHPLSKKARAVRRAAPVRTHRRFNADWRARLKATAGTNPHGQTGVPPPPMLPTNTPCRCTTVTKKNTLVSNTGYMRTWLSLQAGPHLLHQLQSPRQKPTDPCSASRLLLIQRARPHACQLELKQGPTGALLTPTTSTWWQ